MAFELLRTSDVVKGDRTYVVNLYFDYDTNMSRDEYTLNGEILYYYEYDASILTEPENDASLEALIEAFDLWYDQVGPDWQPEAFYLQ